MALKSVLDSLDDVDDTLRSHYAEKDGKFLLNVEGLVPKERLDSFRDNNIALKRERDEIKAARDELAAKYADVDLDAYNAAIAKQAAERDKKLIDAGKVEELFAERIGAMRAEHQKHLDTLAAEKSALEDDRRRIAGQLEGHVIENAIRDAASKTGVRPSAIEDVLLRGRQIYRVHEGKAVPMDGDKVIFGKNGEPLSIDEWMTGLLDRAPHLFESSQGGGARQASSSRAATGGKINRDDPRAILANLDKIATGKIEVA